MKTRFFDDCRTLDELKKAYHRAALLHHPDRGGDTRTMQEINTEYAIRFEKLEMEQNRRAAEDATGSVRPTSEGAGDFIQIIDHLLKMDGLEIELCGRWLWIGGDTKKHKDKLKACGCRWSPKKKLWSWHFAEDGERWNRRNVSMAEIRSKYGSTRFSGSPRMDELPA